MEFSKLELQHIDMLRPYFRENPCRLCDYTAGGTFMWRDLLDTRYAIEDGILYLKVLYPPGIEAFSPPRKADTGDKDENQAWFDGVAQAYGRIIDLSGELNIKPLICAVSDCIKEHVLEIFPGSTVTTMRDWSDYIYSIGDMASLPGRKFSGQRNHINRFTREFPDWDVEPITPGNLLDVRRFFDQYAREHQKDFVAYDEGNRKTLEVLDNLDAYGMFGAALTVSGRIVAASLGERLGDTIYVHVEKADTDYHGAYPMIVTQFAKMCTIDGVAYLNREEDDGVEGLRASKLSYHPSELASKYLIELKR